MQLLDNSRRENNIANRCGLYDKKSLHNFSKQITKILIFLEFAFFYIFYLKKSVFLLLTSDFCILKNIIFAKIFSHFKICG